MNPIKWIPKGYATKLSGFLMILGAIGLGADYLAELIGYDVITSQVTSGPEVVAMFSAGLGLLGLRRALEGRK